MNARPDATSIGRPRIAILGTVELITGAHTTSLPGTNLPTLLSLLAMSPGRPVSNGQLLAALWPDVDPVKASRSLISLVHQLNTALATHLGIAKAVVSIKTVGRLLQVDRTMIDVVHFERLLAIADDHRAAGRATEAIDAYEAALALWRGEPFGGVDVRQLVEESARLRIARHRAEVGLIDESLRTGRGPALVPWLLQRLDTDPFDEQLASAAAQALYQAGRSSDALGVLRSHMDSRRQRGLEPTAAIRQLELDVLDHSLGFDQQPGDDDPALVGRADACAELDAWHDASATSSIMVVGGQTGIGKSALLRWWMQKLGDGELLASGVCGQDQSVPLQPFARLSDEPTASMQVQFDQVARRVGSTAAAAPVLVIDDAQWMTVSSIALLRHLLWHHDVQRLHVVLAVRTPDVEQNHAMTQLLNDAARAGRRHDVHLSPLDRHEVGLLVDRHLGGAAVDVDELVRATGGNPLFAVSLLRSTGPAGESVEAGERPIPDVVQAALGRYVTPLCDRSLAILEAAARLGVAGDAAQLASRTGVTELDVMDALDDVGRGRLLDIDPVGGSYRFVHDLARRVVLAEAAERRSR